MRLSIRGCSLRACAEVAKLGVLVILGERRTIVPVEPGLNICYRLKIHQIDEIDSLSLFVDLVPSCIFHNWESQWVFPAHRITGNAQSLYRT